MKRSIQNKKISDCPVCGGTKKVKEDDEVVLHWRQGQGIQSSTPIYTSKTLGSVNAGWGSVALQDWVRYDGSIWYAITPQKSSLCYDKTADSLMSFNGTAWAAIGGGGLKGGSISKSGERSA